MSGVGHLAAGFAARPLEPGLPLWLLLAASETNEVLYFVFTTTGLESPVRLQVSLLSGVTYLSSGTNPWSHGLFMSVIWSLLAGLLAYLFTRSRRTLLVLASVVFSHWILDFLMHSNLPLFFQGSPLLGLGLEDSGPGLIFMTLLDLVLLAAGLTFWLRSRKNRSKSSILSPQGKPA